MPPKQPLRLHGRSRGVLVKASNDYRIEVRLAKFKLYRSNVQNDGYLLQGAGTLRRWAASKGAPQTHRPQVRARKNNPCPSPSVVYSELCWQILDYLRMSRRR